MILFLAFQLMWLWYRWWRGEKMSQPYYISDERSWTREWNLPMIGGSANVLHKENYAIPLPQHTFQSTTLLRPTPFFVHRSSWGWKLLTGLIILLFNNLPSLFSYRCVADCSKFDATSSITAWIGDQVTASAIDHVEMELKKTLSDYYLYTRSPPPTTWPCCGWARSFRWLLNMSTTAGNHWWA